MKKMLAFLKKPKAVLLAMITAFLAVPAAAGASSPDQSIAFDNGGFSFQLSDIMTTAWNFIGQFNPYLILILALILVPTLIGLIIWLVKKAPRFRTSS